MLFHDQTLVLNFDGACEPINPGGTASWGWILKDSYGNFIENGQGILGTGPGMTNNVAEYEALEQGLRRILVLGSCLHLIIRGDSKLVINQVRGDWRCKKPHLGIRRDRCLELIKAITNDCDIQWIPREMNAEADLLSNPSRKSFVDKFRYFRKKNHRKFRQ